MSTDRRRWAAGAGGSSSARPVVVEDTPPIPHVVPSPPLDSDSSGIELLLVPETPLAPDTQSISISPPPDSLPPLEPPTQPIDSSQPGAPSPSCVRPAPHSSSDARPPLRNIENQPPLRPSPSASPPRKRVRVEPSEVQQLSDTMLDALMPYIARAWSLTIFSVTRSLSLRFPMIHSSSAASCSSVSTVFLPPPARRRAVSRSRPFFDRLSCLVTTRRYRDRVL